MSKSISAPLLRTARLLDLVPFLSSHQGISLKELAHHFDVTTAQMSADLTTLWMCGLPGYTPLELMDLEFESGFVTIRNAPTLAKPRRITFQEVVALLLGLDLITSSLPEERNDLITAASALRKRLGDQLGLPIQLSALPTASAEISTTLANAISSRNGVEIRYHSLYKDEITTRTILPDHFYQSGNHQYIKAYCFTAREYREFRVDRIEQATSVSVPSDLMVPTGNSEKISFSIHSLSNSRESTERFGLSGKQAGNRIELSSFSRQWIERSVMASGASVFLESPQEIRSEVALKAQLILKRYTGA
jgi:proteasome accessory factor C